MYKYLVLFLALCVVVLNAETGDSAKKKDDWIFSGQLQLRPELDGRDFLNKTFGQTFTSMRTRFGIEKTVFDKVTFFVQLEDSRMLGQEKSTLKSLANVDVHQAYCTINNIFDEPISLQAGRIEISYGTHRFIGSNQWHYISRAFDGFRASYKASDFWVDAFAYTIAWQNDYVSGALPAGYSVPQVPDTSFNMYGFWSNIKLFKGNDLDLFGYYEADRKKENGELEKKRLDTSFKGRKNLDISRYTIGLNYNFKFDDFSSILEFGYQGGNLDVQNKLSKKDTVIQYYQQDVQAYVFALRVQYDIAPCSFSLNAEMHSGTKGADTAKIITDFKTYSNSYASRHQMYGYMNYFNDMEKSTNNLGLNDFYLRAFYQPKGSPFSAQFDAHYFMTNQKSYDDKSALGEEFDIVLKYNIVKGVSVEWGGGVFLPGEYMKFIYSINPGKTNETKREDMAFWTYLMLRANF